MNVRFGALALERTIVRSIQSFGLFRDGNRRQLGIVVNNSGITAETRIDIVEVGHCFTDCVVRDWYSITALGQTTIEIE